MSNRLIIAIDPSIVVTGVCFWVGKPVHLFVSSSRDSSKDLWDRSMKQCKAIKEELDRFYKRNPNIDPSMTAGGIEMPRAYSWKGNISLVNLFYATAKLDSFLEDECPGGVIRLGVTKKNKSRTVKDVNLKYGLDLSENKNRIDHHMADAVVVAEKVSWRLKINNL